jgi:hypothetical protein
LTRRSPNQAGENFQEIDINPAAMTLGGFINNENRISVYLKFEFKTRDFNDYSSGPFFSDLFY